MDYLVVSFEEGGEVVQTVGLSANSPEEAIAEVERHRRERPELGYLKPGNSIIVTARPYVRKLASE